MTATKRDKTRSFSAEEKAAMKARAAELRAQKATPGEATSERAFHDAIEALPEPDKENARRLDALVRATAPTLRQKTFYGMPAWARSGKGGKVVCFFQAARRRGQLRRWSVRMGRAETPRYRLRQGPASAHVRGRRPNG
jgi:hypothetical protein